MRPSSAPRAVATALATLAFAACAHGPSAVAVKPNVDPGSTARPAVVVTDSAAKDANPVAGRVPMAPPESAFARGMMPLAPTGVDRFLHDHPTWDGRGVIVGIMDSGIDPGIAGLATTTTGEPKLLDLRDFSGEGRIALAAATPDGDELVVGGTRLKGFGRVRETNGAGPWFAGRIAEIPLGERPASDLNGDGDDTDTLAVVVTRAPDGWVLFADTDGDGSLAGERPVHDYLAARETFGWHAGRRPSPLTLAANFADPQGGQGGAPTLDLFFDTSGHGSHVAGIAAGHDIYGVKGFDGVAPGAYLLGLKIANDAQGGISTTGAMVRALDYALRFAETRRMPLVLNLSFGVGNEAEGTARIDRLFDSVLAMHPDVVFMVAAGNDGPGLSTLGFPASAERVVAVGATYPRAFQQEGEMSVGDGGARGGAKAADPVAFFSARGGEFAKPDFVTPGVAYSTVPRWNTGDETKGGTSMAAPHASGLAALLRSALLQERRTADANEVRQALVASARPTEGDTPLDEGAGLPEVGAAVQWLLAGHTLPSVQVRAEGGAGVPGTSAAYRPGGLRSAGDTTQTFVVTVAPGSRAASGAGVPSTFTLRSDAPWLTAPARATTARGGAGRGTARITLRYRAAALRMPGVYTGVVTGWTSDTSAGPAFRLVNTVVVPNSEVRPPAPATLSLRPNQVSRFVFSADSARPFSVHAETESGARASLYLFEPGGMPFRDVNGMPAGQGDDAALYQVDARDAENGAYEADAVGAPGGDSRVRVEVVQSPVTIHVARDADSVRATLRNQTGSEVPVDGLLLLAGGQRSERVSARGDAPKRLAFRAPDWVKSVVVDVRMDRKQWGSFTDFGVTLFDSAGRQLGQSPMNYALGRLRVELPEGQRGMPVSLGLFPAFADPGSNAEWTAEVTIRLYADPVRAQKSGPVHLTAPASGVGRAVFELPDSPWALGDGFYPLSVLVIRANDHIWTREAGLPQPTTQTK